MVKLDKIGTIGVWIAALSCPACFPALISLVSVMGLGFLSAFESIAINYLLPFFTLAVLITNLFSWFNHKNNLRGLLSVLSPIIILLVLYAFWEFSFSRQVFYVALFLMPLVAIIDVIKPISKSC
jgi:mercuric ion transport protein